MASPSFRLKRNGTVILTWTPPSASTTGITPGTITYTPGGTAIRTLLDAPGGAAVYTLETNAGFGTSFYHRSILAQGVMR